MPKQVLFGPAEFAWLDHNLTRRGFRKVEGFEVRRKVERLGLVPPWPREGQEVGYVFGEFGDELKVVVWTTYLEGLGARERDRGWVGISYGDRMPYFARPKRRTKNFLYNLLEAACIARERVLSRPSCEHTKDSMLICEKKDEEGRKTRRYFWGSPHYCCTLPWDHGLSEDIMARIRPKRKRVRKYNAMRRALGKDPYASLHNHKPWQTTKPWNMHRIS